MAKYYPEIGDKIKLKYWWDGWCWYGLAMLAWSVFWAVRGWGEWSGGFHVGMAILWVFYISSRYELWILKDSIEILRQGREFQSETIRIQQEHINYLNRQVNK